MRLDIKGGNNSKLLRKALRHEDLADLMELSELDTDAAAR
jgi:hypothetical protein